jgi:hypothetical protein
MSEIQPTVLSDEELLRAARSYFLGHGVLSLKYQEALLDRFEKLLDKLGDNE